MDVRNDFLKILQMYVEFPVEEISTSDGFKANSGIDSFTLIELISSIEDEFAIRISNCDLCKFNTIDDIVNYIESKRV